MILQNLFNPLRVEFKHEFADTDEAAETGDSLRTCQTDVFVSYLVSAIIKIVLLLAFILPDHICVTLPCFGRL